MGLMDHPVQFLALALEETEVQRGSKASPCHRVSKQVPLGAGSPGLQPAPVSTAPHCFQQWSLSCASPTGAFVTVAPEQTVSGVPDPEDEGLEWPLRTDTWNRPPSTGRR